MTQRQTLIAGGLAFVIAALAALLSSQYCAPCLVVPVGLAAGYLAARARAEALDTANAATQLGARAGVAAGVGALLGHLAGGAVIAALGSEYGANMLAWVLGGPGTEAAPLAANPVMHAAFVLGVSTCIGFIEVALVAGAGALGALVRYQQTAAGRPGTAITRQ